MKVKFLTMTFIKDEPNLREQNYQVFDSEKISKIKLPILEEAPSLQVAYNSFVADSKELHIADEKNEVMLVDYGQCERPTNPFH